MEHKASWPEHCSKALCSLIPLSRKHRPAFLLGKQGKESQQADAHRAHSPILCKCVKLPPPAPPLHVGCRLNLSIRRNAAFEPLIEVIQSERDTRRITLTDALVTAQVLFVGYDSSRYLTLPIWQYLSLFRPHLKKRGHCRLHCCRIINDHFLFHLLLLCLLSVPCSDISFPSFLLMAAGSPVQTLCCSGSKPQASQSHTHPLLYLSALNYPPALLAPYSTSSMNSTQAHLLITVSFISPYRRPLPLPLQKTNPSSCS